jgi:hypothetical protein
LHENPEALHLTGPHGISLLDHARKGGDPEIVAFLTQRLDPEGSRVKTKRKSAKAMKVKRRKAA